MTNKQAQITINAIKFMLDNEQYSEDVEEALDMAIEALGKDLDDPTTDLISRQAAIDEIRKWKRYETTEGLVERIENMPSAQPERKTGRWIMHIDDLFPAESTMECNQCHERQPITINDHYCPNCGAKMEEADE